MTAFIKGNLNYPQLTLNSLWLCYSIHFYALGVKTSLFHIIILMWIQNSYLKTQMTSQTNKSKIYVLCKNFTLFFSHQITCSWPFHYAWKTILVNRPEISAFEGMMCIARNITWNEAISVYQTSDTISDVIPHCPRMVTHMSSFISVTLLYFPWYCF